jgi:hypothetical protein
MSVPGLSTMQLLLDAGIDELGRWQTLPTTADIPPHRIVNLREKLQALRGCDTVDLLRTGMEHVTGSMAALGLPVSELAPSLLQLATLLEERKRP